MLSTIQHLFAELYMYTFNFEWEAVPNLGQAHEQFVANPLLHPEQDLYASKQTRQRNQPGED